MLSILFIVTLAAFLLALITWGVRHLPAERWQMIAAVPIAKAADGSWQGLNLTFYGFFSATGTTFGCLMLLFLLASLGLPVYVSCALIAFVLFLCVPSSRWIAGIVERKRNTFTVAGAVFTATLFVPPLVIAASSLSRQKLSIPVLPVFAAAINAYVLAEAIGRLACISFGCCYGVPLRQARPWLARLFHRHNLVLHGENKKASYASGFSGEPLIPVQALTSVLFAMGGLAGTALFLAERYRLAALIPLLTSYGWRICSEWLRADYRGGSTNFALPDHDHHLPGLSGRGHRTRSYIDRHKARARNCLSPDELRMGARPWSIALGRTVPLLRAKPGDVVGIVLPRGS